MNKKIIFVLTALFGALSASASLIQISVTGTADSTAMGYTQGESYTFHWVVNDGYTGSDYGVPHEGDWFDSTKNRWESFSSNDPWLWSSVSGDGISGTYAKPVLVGAPREQLLSDDDGLVLWAKNEYPETSLGLVVNGSDVGTLVAYDLNISGLDYSNASFINPTVYLGNYTGTYTSTGGGVYVDDENGNQIAFSATSVTIGVVPEPATVLLFSIGGIGAWMLRRNCKKGEAE